MLAGPVTQGDRGPLEIGRGHLAGHRALEDQIVELGLIAAARTILLEIGGPDRFVSFLRILGLGRIEARLVGQVIGVIPVRDGLAAGIDCARVHLHTIGTHICDRPRLIQRLRQPHGVAGRIAELARSFLLQGRSGERRRGAALQRLGLDILDREARFLDSLLGRLGAAFIAQRQLLQLLPVELDQPRIELRAVLLQLCQHRPVFVGAELLDLGLAANDQAQRHRLDAPCTLGPRQAAPQHRRQGEAIEIVERAARQIGIDQILVELARGLHRIGDGLLSDGIEGNAVDLVGQRLALLQQFADVPADRFSFAIRVSRENEAVRLLGVVGDFLEAALLVAIEFPVHREILVRAHAAILGRQIADMAVAGQNLEVLAEVFFDGFRLGRRFYDDELHCGLGRPLRVYVRIRAKMGIGLTQRQASFCCSVLSAKSGGRMHLPASYCPTARITSFFSGSMRRPESWLSITRRSN